MHSEEEYKKICPIVDAEIPATVAAIANDPTFMHLAQQVLPSIPTEEIKQRLLSCKTFGDFQVKLTYPFLKDLLTKSALSFNANGVENIREGWPYTMISNHRDIILDAAFLNVMTYENGMPFVEVAIGDNLLVYPWIETLVRINGCFLVRRDTSLRGLLAASKLLSSYIHHNLSKKARGVWIAQREGRAKDSNDRTQESLIKMLAMGGSSRDLLSSIMELNIAPLSLSYEYDPCDYLKAREFQIKRDDPTAKKTQADDLLSMQVGVMGYKGNINFSFGRPINAQLSKLKAQELDKSAQVEAITKLIDHEIHLNYSIYPINYYAYDKLLGGTRFAEHYQGETETKITSYFADRLGRIELEQPDTVYLTQKLYEMYANPLINHLAALEDGQKG